MNTRAIRVVLAIWEREMYEYLNNLHINAMRLAVEPLLFIFIFGMGLGNRVNMGDVSYVEFLAPGILFMVVTNNSYMTTSMRLMIARDWDKTLVNALTAPVKPFEVVIGYVFAGITQALAASVIFILLMNYLLGISFGFIPWLVLYIVAIAAFFSSLGVAIAMWLDNPHHLMVVTSLVVMPMSFFCGIFIPVADLPKWIQPVISVIPLTKAVQGARAIASVNNPDILPNLIYIIIVTIAVFFVGVHVFKKKVIT
ncbi:MAG: ABC transporter permease [Methanosarcinaceae archaeon]